MGPQDSNTLHRRTTSTSQDSNTLHRRTTSGSDVTNDNYNYYRQERLFRLARLARRYPRYIRPSQIQRWGQEDYQGNLVQDREFVRNDPARTTNASSSSSSRNQFSNSGMGRS